MLGLWGGFKMSDTFGSFVREKRENKEISLRNFSKMLDLSPVYVSSFERGLRSAPTNDILVRIGIVLVLDEDEIAQMYDLAAQSKNSLTIASDLLEYIEQTENVHKALRLACKYNANDDDWHFFMDYLLNKNVE